MKASILAALLLALAFPAAAQTNAPFPPAPGEQNQIWRQNQIEAFLFDQVMNDLSGLLEMARLQQQIDSVNDGGRDLNRLQLALDRLQYDQQLQRFEAARRILLIAQQGDTARRRRWAAQFAREQEVQRFDQRQRLDAIAAGLRRFSGQ